MTEQGKLVFVLFSILCDIIACAARLYSVEEFYCSENKTTFREVPDSCQLFGSQISGEKTADEVFLNTNTTEKTFWISAKLEFLRRVNPIGLIRCSNNHTVQDFSDCSNRCRRYFMYHGDNKICDCFEDRNKSYPFNDQTPCARGDAICGSGKSTCVAYEHVDGNVDIKCETVTLPGKKYKVIRCSNHENIGHVCNDGTYNVSDNRTTWFEAYSKCQQHDGLLRREIFELGNQPPHGTYWVSFFRKTYYSWTSDVQNVCTVANIKNNGTLHLTTRNCDETFPAMCHRRSTNYGTGMLTAAISYGVGVFGVLCIIVSISILLIKHRRTNRRPKILTTSSSESGQKQELFEIDKNEGRYQNIQEKAGSSRAADPYSLEILMSNDEGINKNQDDYDHSSYPDRANEDEVQKENYDRTSHVINKMSVRNLKQNHIDNGNLYDT